MERFENPFSIMQEDLATENIEVEGLELAHNHLELRVVQKGQREFRIPFFSREMILSEQIPDLSGLGATCRVELELERVTIVWGENRERHQLTPGDSLVLEDCRIWLVDVRQPPLAEIEGITPPFVGRVWHLKGQMAWLGRAGKRLNHLELNHPTVSRTHATFTPDQTGRLSLLAESPASPTSVNGEPIPAGETRLLTHGDLLGFGKVMLRFSSRHAAGPEANRLYVQTLKHLKIQVGGYDGPAVEIKNEKALWLFALLACTWGEPQPVEPLMETFWPEVSAIRGRKNLSYSVGQLKEAFKEVPLDFTELLLRTSASLSLADTYLGEHDYLEVHRLVSSGEAITSESGLDRLLRLYQGAFLPACYEEWAEVKRTQLASLVNRCLEETGRLHLRLQQIPLAIRAGEKLLELDPLHCPAAEILMQAHLAQANPGKAIEVYERVTRLLSLESVDPPVGLLKHYHRAKLGM